jgi:hypothetical protein
VIAVSSAARATCSSAPPRSGRPVYVTDEITDRMVNTFAALDEKFGGGYPGGANLGGGH